MKNKLHRRGLLWHNHKKKYSFLAIPKCASNSIRDMSGCKSKADFKIYPSYKRFTIIREPIARYVSGFIEVMLPASDYPKGRYHYNLGLNNKMKKYLDSLNKEKNIVDTFIKFTNGIIERGFFEVHTEPQHYYIINDIVIYKLENMNEFIKDFHLKNISFKNKTEFLNEKNKILEFLSNDNFKNKLTTLFKQDITLYNSFDNKLIYRGE